MQPRESCSRGQLERWVLAEDRLLQLLERGRRLEPELRDQPPSQVGVHAQRLGLPARAVEGEHQLRPEALA